MGIKRNFIYSVALTGTNYIFPLIIYPYISRVLGVENIGLVNFIDSIINYMVLLSMMGISVIGIREIAAAKTDRNRLNSVFSSLFTLNAIATLVAVAVVVILTLTVTQLRENSHLMWIGVFKLIGNLFLVEWLYNGLENFKFITIRSILVKSAYAVSIFLLVRAQSDIAIYYMLTCLMTVLNATINFTYARHFVTLSLFHANLASVWKPFITAGFYMILTSLYTTLNTTFLGFATNDKEVGYYYTATRLYYIFSGIYTAFTNVMLPRMSSLISEGNKEEFSQKVKLSYEILLTFALPIIIGTFIFAPAIIQLLSGDGYAGAIIPLRITIPLILIIGCEQIMVIQILIPMKQDKTILINSSVGATISIVLNFLIVKHLGAIGSSITWFCSELAIMILSFIAVRHIIPIIKDYRFFLFSILKFVLLIPILIFIARLPLNYILSLAIGIAITICYTIIIIFKGFPAGHPLSDIFKSTISKLHKTR